MKRQRPPIGIQPVKMKVDSRGQEYLVYPDGQMRRAAQNGRPLPRVKMSKKERLKFWREYNEIREMDASKLANKILETPVVNPVIKPDPELGNLPVEESKMEIENA